MLRGMGSKRVNYLFHPCFCPANHHLESQAALELAGKGVSPLVLRQAALVLRTAGTAEAGVILITAELGL